MGKTISVIGGDLRQLTLAELLSNEGYDIKIYGFKDEDISKKFKASKGVKDAASSDILILPLPASTDGVNINAPFFEGEIKLEDIAKNVKKSTLITGGHLNKSIYNIFSENKCIDYGMREELMIKNAVATAEGAIEIAMEETPITLNKSKCLIIGYGRIGKVLAKYLKSLGADVCVSARKYSDIAWIEVNGYTAIHNKEIEYTADKYDLIFNTVPTLILDENILEKIDDDCVVIDLASKPGGVDFTKAKDLGLKVIWALSLPGKVIS